MHFVSSNLFIIVFLLCVLLPIFWCIAKVAAIITSLQILYHNLTVVWHHLASGLTLRRFCGCCPSIELLETDVIGAFWALYSRWLGGLAKSWHAQCAS